MDIFVTDKGHQALERRSGATSGTQVNIVNSTVGQLALGNVNNIDVKILLEGMERALENMDASEMDKEQARSTIQRMREVGGTVASSTVSNLLAAALRQALGLP